MHVLLDTDCITFADVLPSHLSLGLVPKKINPTQQKQATRE